MVLLIFLCGISVNKIPHNGIVVISNSNVCDVCVLNIAPVNEVTTGT